MGYSNKKMVYTTSMNDEPRDPAFADFSKWDDTTSLKLVLRGLECSKDSTSLGPDGKPISGFALFKQKAFCAAVAVPTQLTPRFWSGSTLLFSTPRSRSPCCSSQC